jgi:hypothetical protein
MQLYNTLSAEERAIMIDDAGKQRLTLSFYAYAQIQINTIQRFILVWNPRGSWSHLCSQRESTPNCHFLLIISTLSQY